MEYRKILRTYYTQILKYLWLNVMFLFISKKHEIVLVNMYIITEVALNFIQCYCILIQVLCIIHGWDYFCASVPDQHHAHPLAFKHDKHKTNNSGHVQQCKGIQMPTILAIIIINSGIQRVLSQNQWIMYTQFQSLIALN